MSDKYKKQNKEKARKWGGIRPPLTCMINYVNMQPVNVVNMQLNNVYMQHVAPLVPCIWKLEFYKSQNSFHQNYSDAYLV